VRPGSIATVANAVSDELSSTFGRAEMTDATKLCFERDESFVVKYVDTTFTLDSDPAPTSTRVTANGADGTAEEDGTTLGEAEADWGTEPSEDADGSNAADSDDTPTRTRTRRRKRRDIMERFAAGRGYVSQGHSTFAHPDGRTLIHTTEAFPWKEYDQ